MSFLSRRFAGFSSDLARMIGQPASPERPFGAVRLSCRTARQMDPLVANGAMLPATGEAVAHRAQPHADIALLSSRCNRFCVPPAPGARAERSESKSRPDSQHDHPMSLCDHLPASVVPLLPST